MAIKEFKTESKRLLDMMANSIYTNTDIFLRELISNASDALDKRHILSLTDDRISFDDPKIRIISMTEVFASIIHKVYNYEAISPDFVH